MLLTQLALSTFRCADSGSSGGGKRESRELSQTIGGRRQGNLLSTSYSLKLGQSWKQMKSSDKHTVLEAEAENLFQKSFFCEH